MFRNYSRQKDYNVNRNQLWSSILQQAISGRLVPQLDSEPEVEQIGPAPAQNEVPFELPPKWKWVQIGNVFSMQAGKFIKASNILDDGLYPCYGANGIRGYVDTFNHEGTCNLIGRVGSCGSVHITTGKIYVTDNAVIATQCALVDADCAYYFLTSLNLKQHATATAQPLLNKGTIAKVWYPLAPLSEQRRIVAMLEEIRPLVERFGEAQERLVKLEAKFPGKLKASILQQAIKGLLVPQLDSEPEVEQVGPAPKPEEVQFELPPRWKWVQLNQLTLKITDGTHNPPPNTGSGIPVLGAKDISKDGFLSFEKVDRWATEDAWVTESKKVLIEATDVLLVIVGATIGRVALVMTKDKFILQRSVAVIKPNLELIESRYLLRVIASPYIQGLIKQTSSGTAQKGIYLNKLKSIWIPLPPLEEQRRIVAKLEEVFAGVKQLGSLMEYA